MDLSAYEIAGTDDPNRQVSSNRWNSFLSALESGIATDVAAANKFILVDTYGAVGDGVTDDTVAVQAAVDAVGSAGGVVFFTPGKTYLVTSVTLPLRKAMILSGYGATIKSATGSPMLSKMPPDQTEALNYAINYNISAEGLTFSGSGAAGQVGLQIGATYGAFYRDLHFVSCDTGLDLQFCLMARVTMCRATNCRTDGFVVRIGSWTGASNSNSQSNHTVLDQCRNYAYAGMNSAFKIRDSSGVVLDNCVGEGANPVYNVDFYSASTVVKTFIIRNLHVENTPSAAHIRCQIPGGDVTIDTVFFQTATTLLDTTGTTSSGQFHVLNIPYWPTGAKITSASNEPSMYFVGDMGLAKFTKDTALWTAGVIPDRCQQFNREGFYWNSGVPLKFNSTDSAGTATTGVKKIHRARVSLASGTVINANDTTDVTLDVPGTPQYTGTVAVSPQGYGFPADVGFCGMTSGTEGTVRLRLINPTAAGITLTTNTTWDVTVFE